MLHINILALGIVDAQYQLNVFQFLVYLNQVQGAPNIDHRAMITNNSLEVHKAMLCKLNI
jgi:hypothetical protein